MQVTITIDDKMEGNITNGKFVPKGDITREIKRRETFGFYGHAVCLALIADMPQKAVEVCEHAGYFARAYEIADKYGFKKEQRRLAGKIREDVKDLILPYSTPAN